MLLSVFVKANSKKGPLIQQLDAKNLVIFVRQPATEGKANETVIKLLAEHFGVAKSEVKLVRGTKSKQKLFEIMKNPLA